LWSYIDDLIRENQQLRAAAQEPGRRTEPPGRPGGSTAQNGAASSPSKDKSAAAAAEPEANAPGPLLAEGPWFFNLNIPHTPILIGETSDAGFATRFRQAIATSSEQKSHIPRTNYPSDERLLTLYDTDCPWPSVVRARLLVRVALKHVSENYHIVRRSETLQGLESTLQNPQLSDSFFKAKLWALFAIGEMYSTRTTSTEDDFPGMRYFVRATRILRIVSERPRLDAIEIRLLLVSPRLTPSPRCPHTIIAYPVGIHKPLQHAWMSSIVRRTHVF
jgi:proline utilization trans-activator